MSGSPSYPLGQEHTGLSTRTLQSAFNPHGDGSHGSIGGAGGKLRITGAEILIIQDLQLNHRFKNKI